MLTIRFTTVYRRMRVFYVLFVYIQLHQRWLPYSNKRINDTPQFAALPASSLQPQHLVTSHDEHQQATSRSQRGRSEHRRPSDGRQAQPHRRGTGQDRLQGDHGGDQPTQEEAHRLWVFTAYLLMLLIAVYYKGGTCGPSCTPPSARYLLTTPSPKRSVQAARNLRRRCIS